MPAIQPNSDAQATLPEKTHMGADRTYCCEMMTAQLTHHCEIHADIFACPDALIVYKPQFDEYGIIIHDGGSASITIHYCPWCGTALPNSKRDRWFDELAALGFDDPGIQPIPAAFLTDAWYRHTPNDASPRAELSKPLSPASEQMMV